MTKFDEMTVPDRRQFLSALPESVAPNPRRLARTKFDDLPVSAQEAVVAEFGPQADDDQDVQAAQCAATTHAGTQCTRGPSGRSKYCTQHQRR